MKLSIITINLNNKSGFQKTIDSVISQTFKDFEWIIIDGGSTDGSKELIEQYSQYITYWVSEPDKGIYNAMNKGILQAKGKYLQFLNSGDELYSNTILHELFDLDLYGDIIYGNVICKNSKIQEIRKYNEPISLSYLISVKTINHQASFIKRDLFKNSLYNEDFRIVSDWEFWILQAIKGSTFQYIDKFIVFFDYTGITSKTSELQKEENKQVINNLPWAIKKDLDELFVLRKTMANGYIKMIHYYFEKGKIQQKVINAAIHILNFIEKLNSCFHK